MNFHSLHADNPQNPTVPGAPYDEVSARTSGPTGAVSRPAEDRLIQTVMRWFTLGAQPADVLSEMVEALCSTQPDLLLAITLSLFKWTMAADASPSIRKRFALRPARHSQFALARI